VLIKLKDDSACEMTLFELVKNELIKPEDKYRPNFHALLKT
jgi:hypothetical protein